MEVGIFSCLQYSCLYGFVLRLREFPRRLRRIWSIAVQKSGGVVGGVASRWLIVFASSGGGPVRQDAALYGRQDACRYVVPGALEFGLVMGGRLDFNRPAWKLMDHQRRRARA